MENTNKEIEHNKISPTAKISGYWRSLSDIPFSKEIADSIEAEKTARQILGDRFSMLLNFTPPIMEARYKAIDFGLKKYKVENVLELAAGLSPRGLGLATSNIKYVGTDLPEIYSECYPVINKIAQRLGLPTDNLHFQAANVLNKSELENAVNFFNSKKIGICNEGLLMYLNKEEKAIMAKHIRDLLSILGGYWITTDIAFNDIRNKLLNSLKPELKKTLESALGIVSSQTDRDIAGNDFKNEFEAIKFYEDLGFKIEMFPFYDGSYNLFSLINIIEEMKEPVLNSLSKSMVWVLTLNT